MNPSFRRFALAGAAALMVVSGSTAMAQATPANGNAAAAQGNVTPQEPRTTAPQAPMQPGAAGVNSAPTTSTNRAGLPSSQSTSTERTQFDINNGSESAMQSELGISAGEARALREYREKNGRIGANTSLESVPGLSAESRQKMQGKLRYDGTPDAAPEATERTSPDSNR